MAVKFPLKMTDGTMVRTLEELREHFDLTAVLAYYDSGRLTKWLENFYYDEEAKNVLALDPGMDGFAKKLCAILGVEYSESDARQVDLDDISRRNERLERLKQYTADDTILAAVDRVAFTQEELADLLNKGVTEVYLLGDQFTVPEGFEKNSYQCINDPVVRFGKVERLEKAAEQGDTRAKAKLYRFRAVELNDAEAQVRLGDCYDNGTGVVTSHIEAVRWYRKAAEQGYAEAQFHLGYCYYAGYGVKRNEEEASKWYRLAVEQGHAEAFSNLVRDVLGALWPIDISEVAKLYKTFIKAGHAENLDKDMNEFANWCVRSAEQNDAEAQVRLGDCYYNGTGVDEDKDEALKWYKKAAKRGYAPAQVKLGDYYDDYSNDKRDVEEAVKWYRKAAVQGCAEAQSKLGAIYEVYKEDFEEAVKWYRKAAEQGYAEAQTELGDCYYYGIGVEEDTEEAVRLYRIAAEQECISAQIRLGEHYECGDRVGANQEEALKWFIKAAEQGDTPTQVRLGDHYYKGECGVEQDYEEAAKWYKLAAEKGDRAAELMFKFLDTYKKATELSNAEAQLGEYYLHGLGVPLDEDIVDRDEAISWFRQAANQGNAEAQKALSECKKFDE